MFEKQDQTAHQNLRRRHSWFGKRYHLSSLNNGRCRQERNFKSFGRDCSGVVGRRRFYKIRDGRIDVQ
uniref:Uncharacterized protein n=1 Tax=Romanomermis culicivorax TaxID=13658 RepID=A0A915JH10_ROMCU